MKVRIGIGLGAAGVPSDFAAVVDSLEAAGVDSLWLPELVYGPAVDPFIGMAHALARTSRLKVGSGVAVLPGRHPVLVAKQLASLAGLAPRRVLPVFGLKPARPGELAAFPVPPGRRAAVFDESLTLIRLLLREEAVSFHGEFFSVESALIAPRPARPLDIWLGGSAPGALRRIGRLGDGWLGSFITPAEAGAGRQVIEEAAAEAGREIEPDHFGVSLALATGAELEQVHVVAPGSGGRTRTPPRSSPTGWADARRLIEEYVAAGLTKFVVRAGGTAPDSGRFPEDFNRELVPLQTAAPRGRTRHSSSRLTAMPGQHPDLAAGEGHRPARRGGEGRPGDRRPGRDQCAGPGPAVPQDHGPAGAGALRVRAAARPAPGTVRCRTRRVLDHHVGAPSWPPRWSPPARRPSRPATGPPPPTREA